MATSSQLSLSSNHALTTDTSSHTLTNPAQSLDIKSVTFAALIVELVTGVPISNLPEANRESIVAEAIQIYLDFLKQYVEETRGKRTALQYKIFEGNGDLSMLSRFQDLDEGLQEAHTKFIETIANS